LTAPANPPWRGPSHAPPARDGTPAVTDRMTARARGPAVRVLPPCRDPPPTDPIGPSHVDGRLQLGLGPLGLVVGAAVLVQVWVPLLFFPVALLVELGAAGPAVVFDAEGDVAWFGPAAIGGVRPGPVIRSSRT
jgi:hypothetical protein